MYRNFKHQASTKKGHALVINNHKFDYMPERHGTEVDRANITSLLQQLDYTVHVVDNLKVEVDKQTCQ